MPGPVDPVNPLFNILKQGDGSGEAPDLRQVGNAVSGTNEMPVVSASDLAGNFQHVPVRNTGDADGSQNIPTLPGKDLAGNLQHADVRASGQASGSNSQVVLDSKNAAGTLQYKDVRAQGDPASGASNATPSMGYKDPSGNLAYANLDSAGNVLVSSEGGGTPVDTNGNAASVHNAYVVVATLTLTASKKYDSIQARISSSPFTEWKMEQNNNATITLIGNANSGPGQFTTSLLPLNITRSAGATGTQTLIVSAKQINGSDGAGLNATISAIQR